MITAIFWIVLLEIILGIVMSLYVHSSLDKQKPETTVLVHSILISLLIFVGVIFLRESGSIGWFEKNIDDTVLFAWALLPVVFIFSLSAEFVLKSAIFIWVTIYVFAFFPDMMPFIRFLTVQAIFLMILGSLQMAYQLRMKS